MSFVRKIVNTDELRKAIDIPQNITNDLVEIIILPVEDDLNVNCLDKKLKFVKNNLIGKESAAWSRLIDNEVGN